MLQALHHVAIIASDYERSKRFYTEILRLEIVREVYRAGRDSWKLDLAVNGTYQIELFSFPNPPPRPSRPEACGLRHLAFSVKNLTEAIEELAQKASKPSRFGWTNGRAAASPFWPTRTACRWSCTKPEPKIFGRFVRFHRDFQKDFLRNQLNLPKIYGLDYRRLSFASNFRISRYSHTMVTSRRRRRTIPCNVARAGPRPSR